MALGGIFEVPIEKIFPIIDYDRGLTIGGKPAFACLGLPAVDLLKEDSVTIAVGKGFVTTWWKLHHRTDFKLRFLWNRIIKDRKGRVKGRSTGEWNFFSYDLGELSWTEVSYISTAQAALPDIVPDGLYPSTSETSNDPNALDISKDSDVSIAAGGGQTESQSENSVLAEDVDITTQPVINSRNTNDEVTITPSTQASYEPREIYASDVYGDPKYNPDDRYLPYDYFIGSIGTSGEFKASDFGKNSNDEIIINYITDMQRNEVEQASDTEAGRYDDWPDTVDPWEL